MRRTLFVLMLTLLGATVFAKPVDVATARRVADSYMNAMGMKNTAAMVDITSQTPFTEFYVFAAEEGGFVLVSADDCVVPVLGYSTSSSFETKDMPENILGWLQDYEKEIRYHKSLGETDVQGSEAAKQWQMLLAGAMPPAPLPTAVSPMLTTTWNQSPRYNALCPADSASNLSVTGCVATATAQVMKYYNHPTTGYGSHTYTSDRTVNGVNYYFPNLTANFGATTYQWSNMPNALSGTSSTTQINAVATLMYHIGVAVEMSYSPSASGAHNYNTGGDIDASSQTALMKYFKYRPDMAALAREDYSDAEFSTLLCAELDQQRPILYSGSNISAGHSFVFDGYDNNGKFHVNWGWGGSNNGYFTMGSLNPGVGGIGGNSSGTYNLNNVALIGIRPNTNWSTTGNTTVTATTTGHGSASGGGSYPFGDTVTLSATANSGYRFTGWTDGCKYNPREIIANGGSYSFTATFAPISGDTLHYCPGNRMLSNYRSTSGSTVWGIHLPTSVLNSSNYLGAVQLYVAAIGSYTMTIYTGASHNTTAATVTFTCSDGDLDTWKTIYLSNLIPATQDIWIMFNYNDSGYPASFTYGSGVAASFVWGSNFSETGLSWNVTAMIKGIFSDGSPIPNPCNLTTFPYTQNFDDSTASCWDTYNANGGSTKWGFYDGTYGYNGTTCIGIRYAANSDDWLMSPTIALAGNYTVAWKARIRSTSYPETYQVLWYDGTDTTILFQETLTSTNYVDRSANFYVPANTTGRIVFRYISDDQYFLYLDNIVIDVATVQTQCTITALSNNTAYGTVSGGGIYNIGATVTLTATAVNNYHFAQWQDGNASNPRSFTANGDATYTATFEPNNYTVTVASNNSSWGVVSGGGSYAYGTVITLSAVPNTGYRFVQWQDGNTQMNRNITVTGNASYTATFEADEYSINVTCNPAQGSVSGAGTYGAGSEVTLRAYPYSGFRFVRWQDNDTLNPRTITVSANATYTAYFEALPPAPQYTITVASNNPEWGTVDGGGTYDEGTTVTLTANAASGYHFVKWHDDDTLNPRTITVTGDTTYTAFFAADPHEGVDDVDAVGISLYPNPATAILNIVVAENGEAVILDVMGRLAASISVVPGTNTVDVSVLPSGVYFIKMGDIHSSFIKR